MDSEKEGKYNNRLMSVHIILPFVIMILLTVIVFFFMRGRAVSSNESRIGFLTEEQKGDHYKYSGEVSASANVIVFYGDEEDSVHIAQRVAYCMDVMRLNYQYIDLDQEKVNFDNVELMLLCTGHLEYFGDSFESFIKWLSTGNMVWCMVPECNKYFEVISRMLGIESYSGEYLASSEYLFKNGIVPGMDGMSYSDEYGNVLLVTDIDKTSTVYIEDKKTHTPMMWETEEDNRHVTVINCGMFSGQHFMDGLLTHIIAKHREATVWPVMNSMMVFLDDFPAPQPEGYDERLLEQFGYNTQSFFMNVWWPDMKKLAETYDLKYTGVLVETYNDNMESPFERGVAGTLLRYYGAELVSADGEIALHGYNHQPLIEEGYPNEDDYPGWPDPDNMRRASEELYSYAGEVFPELEFTTYVPPSNLLSDTGYEQLRKAIPQIKVISGVFTDSEDGTCYCTDFEENEDGIINVPRVTSGFIQADYNTADIYSALFCQGTFSHFVHPDDVLDEERGALTGWSKMRDCFDETLAGVKKTYPMLRGMTASSGGAAVQRRQYLRPSYSILSDGGNRRIDIKLEGFADESWLALCIDGTPGKISGGELFSIGDDYYWVRCDSENISIEIY